MVCKRCGNGDNDTMGKVHAYPEGNFHDRCLRNWLRDELGKWKKNRGGFEVIPPTHDGTVVGSTEVPANMVQDLQEHLPRGDRSLLGQSGCDAPGDQDR